MFESWVNWSMLVIESQQVIALRLMKIAKGGSNAFDEAYLMIAEKVAEAGTTAASLGGGASVNSVVSTYRTVVQANARRLEG